MSVADIGIELERLILGQYADGFDSGIHAVAEREVNDPVPSTERDGGFGDEVRQDTQP